MQLSEFDYNLPPELIAQKPMSPRDHSRLLVLSKKSGEIEHHNFFELDQFLNKGDVLVFNNSKVFPARFFGTKKITGGKIEILLLNQINQNSWEAVVGGKGKKENLEIIILNQDKPTELEVKLIKKTEGMSWRVEFNFSGKELEKQIDKYGITPLPPYIKAEADAKKYQTVYAKHRGSAAAPTAGLHFTERLLKKLKTKGVQIEFVTLHVGLGTFEPVREEKIEDHQIHSEFAVIDPKTAERLNKAIKNKQRIIAVGTTSVRTLEASFAKGKIQPISDWVKIFIYPGYKFKVVGAMITNFHLPKSTLLMLISAFAGKDKIDQAYAEAIREKYRFFSFGDGMMIL
ncbi:MAG: tRNA preQ1(34) S-adenosylmethionine ribosyltransferase-isomerase QueA [Patescibacteria group bacterium]